MNKKNTVKNHLKVLLVGCPLESGNGGVTALGYSAIANIVKRHPEIEIFIQHNSGKQDELIVDIEGQSIVLRPVFFHRSSSLLESQGLRLLGLLAPMVSKMPDFFRASLIRRFRLFAALVEVDAVLDVSGGDSFTSIYGEAVFDGIATIKMIAIRFQVPLYLLPQSYGPFLCQKHANSARFIFENARLIGCRDAHGKPLVSDLAPRVDSSRIIESPDIAFGMETVSSKGEAFRRKCEADTLIGLNISGLLYFNNKSFGLNFDYPDMIHRIVEWVIESTDAVIVLVPHVVATAKQHMVSEKTDVNAIEVLSGRYSDLMEARIFTAEEYADPREIKGVIGGCDFFMGARMHACIAAISQGIPTLCHAYSDKFTGVMSMVGMEDTVVDMRSITIDSVLLQLESELSHQSDRQNMLDDMDEHKMRIESYFDIVIKDLVKLKQT